MTLAYPEGWRLWSRVRDREDPFDLDEFVAIAEEEEQMTPSRAKKILRTWVSHDLISEARTDGMFGDVVYRVRQANEGDGEG